MESNIHRRGEVGGSAKKIGLRIKELERLYGIQNGSTHFQGNQYSKVVMNNSEAPKAQEQLAKDMGMSVDTLQNYKMLADMIPELDELVQIDIVNIESNLRQRVLGNTNPVKLGRCFEFLNNWYGFIQGTNQYSFTKVLCSSENHNPKNQIESKFPKSS